MTDKLTKIVSCQLIPVNINFFVKMQHLNEVDRARIVADLESGRTVRDLALKYGVGKSTIGRIKVKWESEHNVSRKDGSGRIKVTSEEHDEALIQYLRENPFHTGVDAINVTNFPASRSTACRRIKSSELGSYCSDRKPFLTNHHKEQRVGFALEYLHMENLWDNVVFSDEKTFKSCNNGRVRVYRPRNTRFEERYVSYCDNARGRFSVNVWGWISSRGPGVLCVVEERMNAETYLRILAEVMVPSVTPVFPRNYFVYQHDNCPIHTAQVVQTWLQENNITVLPWPSRSPDINPIENAWGLMIKKMRLSNFRPQNRQQLIEGIRQTWTELTPDYCQQLMASMPRRLNAVLQSNGAVIKY